MKRFLPALVFSAFFFCGQTAHADIIDDAIGNIQRAIGDAYQPDESRDSDRRDDDVWRDGERRQQSDERRRQYEDRRRQLDDRRQQLDDRQRQLDQERRQLEDDRQRLEDDYYR